MYCLHGGLRMCVWAEVSFRVKRREWDHWELESQSAHVAPHGCWELNSGLQKEHCVLLTAESPLCSQQLSALNFAFVWKHLRFLLPLEWRTWLYIWYDCCFKVRHRRVAPFSLVFIMVAEKPGRSLGILSKTNRLFSQMLWRASLSQWCSDACLMHLDDNWMHFCSLEPLHLLSLDSCLQCVENPNQ